MILGVIANVVLNSNDSDQAIPPSETEKLNRQKNSKEMVKVAYQFSSAVVLKNSRNAIVEYFSKTLRWLNLNLCTKAENYPDQHLKLIFLLNNYYKISKLFANNEMENMFSVNRSNSSSDNLANSKNSLLELFSLAGKNSFKETYEADILKFKQEYLKSWGKLVGILDFKIEPIIDGKIKEKDRQLAKDRFSAFNKEFEESISVQAKYFIPNNELANDLREIIIKSILSRYKPFHDIYDNSNFATHKDKYIKYKPEDIKAKIKCIFSEY